MARRFLGLGVTTALLLSVGGCAVPTGSTDTTTVRIVGSAGARITGFYLQDGLRRPIEEPLPFTFTHTGLSELEVFKTRPNDTFTLAAQTDDQGWHSEGFKEAGDQVLGLRVRVDGGLYIDVLKTAP
jgi:hypothetical protein